MPKLDNINIAIAYRDDAEDYIVQSEWWTAKTYGENDDLDWVREELNNLDGVDDYDQLVQSIEDILQNATSLEVVEDETQYCGEIFAYIWSDADEKYYLYKNYPTGGGFADSVEYNRRLWDEDVK